MMFYLTIPCILAGAWVLSILISERRAILKLPGYSETIIIMSLCLVIMQGFLFVHILIDTEAFFAIEIPAWLSVITAIAFTALPFLFVCHQLKKQQLICCAYRAHDIQ